MIKSKRRQLSGEGVVCVGLGQWMRLCTRRCIGWVNVIPGYDVYCDGGELSDGVEYVGDGVSGVNFCDVVEIVNSVWKWWRVNGDDEYVDFGGVRWIVREWLSGRETYERMCGYIIEWSRGYDTVDGYGNAVRTSDSEFYGECVCVADVSMWEKQYRLYYLQ